MDLIDRQAAIDAIGIEYGIDASETLEGVTEVDAVEVVRCKNCVYFYEPNSFSGKCTLRGDYIFTNDFCSYAVERRTDETS